MSRWKFPQTAAKRAARVASEGAKSKREFRQSVLLLVGIILVGGGIMTVDAIWVRATARERWERHQRHVNHTNRPAAPVDSTNAISGGLELE